MHVRAARARAAPVGARGAVRRHELTCSTQPLIAGLDYREDFISRDEEAALIEQLEALDLAPFRFHGWTGNRLTQSFGWRYDFDDASFTPTEPIPDWLLPLREQAAAFAGSAAGRFRPRPARPLRSRRRHRLAPRPPVFDQVVGVSLGAPTILRFRQRTAPGFRAPACRSSRARPIC